MFCRPLARDVYPYFGYQGLPEFPLAENTESCFYRNSYVSAVRLRGDPSVIHLHDPFFQPSTLLANDHSRPFQKTSGRGFEYRGRANAGSGPALGAVRFSVDERFAGAFAGPPARVVRCRGADREDRLQIAPGSQCVFARCDRISKCPRGVSADAPVGFVEPRVDGAESGSVRRRAVSCFLRLRARGETVGLRSGRRLPPGLDSSSGKGRCDEGWAPCFRGNSIARCGSIRHSEESAREAAGSDSSKAGRRFPGVRWG